MAVSSLFPNDGPLAPAEDRTEPAFWLRRLVVIPDLSADAQPIRDIAFRRGLNIIQTELRNESDETVLGHDVGKTLLTRLIRYTLGEQTFARRSEYRRILDQLPTAVVITQWRIAGVDWCVARPFQSGRRSPSFCVATDSWSQLISHPEHRLDYEVFLNQIRNATLGSLPGPPTLPSQTFDWVKILAFLSRDWQCGYRHFNEWRSADSESGTQVERNEASMLLRWLMGLYDARELTLREQYLGLTSKRQGLQTESQRLHAVLGSADPILQRKLALTEDLLIGEGLFAQQLDTALDTEIQKLESLRRELRTESRLPSLETAEDEISVTLADAMKEFAVQDARDQFLRAQLDSRLSASSSGSYLANSPYEYCTHLQCPMKLENRATPTTDPANDEITSSLREEIADEQRKVLQKLHQCDQLRARHKDIRSQLRAERLRVSEAEAGINRSIGRWETHREDVEFRKDVVRKIAEYKSESRRLRSELKQSGQRQELLRKQQQKQLRRMSGAFSQVLKDVFSSAANGRFKVEATGLRPEVDEQIGSGGAALSVMAKVLSFDLGCLSASMTGIGSHPRFVVHDSPRASDIEERLFHQLFRVVAKWEKVFPPEESSFQYIITTTTPPPPEMAGADVPFVRSTLSARTDNDRLLRVRY